MPSSDILVDYSYLGPGGNVAGATTLLVLCIGAVFVRFWGRTRAKFGLKSDDWLILISLVGDNFIKVKCLSAHSV